MVYSVTKNLLAPALGPSATGIHRARAQGGIPQVSSCLASPGADHLSDGWRRWFAGGLAACAAAVDGNGDPQLLQPPTAGPCGAWAEGKGQ